MRKVLILGSNGLLGQYFIKRFSKDYELICSSVEKENFSGYNDIAYHALDLASRRDIQSLISNTAPDVIINTAAYTNVDGCENEREKCWEVNVHAVAGILESNFRKNPVFVQISTDYVFDGEKGMYRETDKPNPRGNYARSKLAAENLISGADLEYMIIRTQVLFGTGKKVRPNFVTWVIEQLRRGDKIHVVDDQIGNPTYAPDVCESVYRLLEKQAYGLYHVSGRERISRYDFALRIAEEFGLNRELIERTSTEMLKQDSPRPMDSSFILDKLVNNIGWEPHDIKGALELFKKELAI